MTGRVRASFDRLGPWPAFTGFALIGCAAWAAALTSVLPVVHAITTDAPLVALGSHAAMGLPIGVAFFALAAITLSSPSTAIRARHRTASRRFRLDGPVLCLWIAAIAIALTLVAAPVTRVVIGSIAQAHGYVACPALGAERRERLRWARRPAACPRPAEEAM